MSVVAETPSTRTDWLTWRRQGLGGSDAAAIAGLDPFHSPLDVWLDKTGHLPLDAGGDEVMAWGKRLETVLIEAFEDETGLRVVARQSQWVNRAHPWLRATLDGFVWDGGPREGGAPMPDGLGAWREGILPLGVLETKSASRRAGDWQEGVPAHVEAQVQHQLLVTGLERAWVAVLLTAPVIRFQVHEVAADAEAQEVLFRLEQRFWRRVLENDPPPAGSGDTESLRQAYAEPDPGTVVELDEAALELAENYRRAAALLKSAKAEEETLKAQLMALLGEREVGLYGGRPLVTWKAHQERRLDEKALRLRHPKLADRFTSQRTVRRFTVASDGGPTTEED